MFQISRDDCKSMVPGCSFSDLYKHRFNHIANSNILTCHLFLCLGPGRVAQSVGHLTHKSGVLGLIPGLATYFRFSFRFFKNGSCQLLANVCARSTG